MYNHLELTLQPSQLFKYVMAVAYLIFLFGASVAPVDFAIRLPLIFMVLLLWRASYLRYYCFRSLGLFGDAVTQIVLDDNSWRLRLASGVEIETRLKASSFFTYRLMVLHFHKAPDVILFTDSADPELLRRLRIRLNLDAQNLVG